MRSEQQKRKSRAKARSARNSRKPTSAQVNRALRAALGHASPEIVGLVFKIIENVKGDSK